MKINGLFDGLQNSLKYKQNVINVKDSGGYNYMFTVSVKHKTKVLGFNGKPYYTYHDEIRFDHERYHKDLANADQAINNWQQAINDYIKSAVDEYSNVSNKIQNIKEQINSVGNDVVYYKQKLNYCNSYNANLNSKVLEQQSQLNYCSNYLINIQQQIRERPHQINQEKQQIQNNINLKNTIINTNKNQTQENSEQKTELIKMLQSKSQIELAQLVFEFFGKDKMKEILYLIDSIGYNVDHLAYLAVDKNNLELFEYALKQGAKCDLYSIENQTLLEKILNADMEDFFSLAMKNSDGAFCTMVSAAKNDDLKVISKLYELDNKIFNTHNELSIFTPLQALLLAGEYDAVKCIINLDNSVLDIPSKYGDSSFKIALSSANSKIIKLLSDKVDMQKELMFLAKHDQGVLLERTMQECTVDTKVLQEVSAYCLSQQKTSIIKTIIKNGLESFEFVKFVFATKDQELIDNLIQSDLGLLSDKLIDQLLQENLISKDAKKEIEEMLEVIKQDEEEISFSGDFEITKIVDFE